MSSVAEAPRNAILQQLLQQYWQATSFRDLQQEAVTATIDKEDIILILSTGD